MKINEEVEMKEEQPYAAATSDEMKLKQFFLLFMIRFMTQNSVQTNNFCFACFEGLFLESLAYSSSAGWQQ